MQQTKHQRRHEVLAAAAARGASAFDKLEDRQLMAAHVGGATYATIQAAVDAAPAGGVVTVDAGNYAESVRIGKALTVRGAQAGVDARTAARVGNGAVETVVTGATTSAGVAAVFTVAADGVTIDGFTVQGQTTRDLNTGAAIVINPGVSGTRVVNDVVQNNVAGLFLANASDANAAVVQHDVFRNNNNAGANGGRGIYTDQSISGGRVTNVRIDANAFVNNRGGSGTTTLESAVAFESTSNAQSQTDIAITGNTFDGNGKAVLFFNSTGVRFTGNVVTRGLDWYSGIVRFEGNDHDVTITGNTLYANAGPAVAVDTKGVPGDNGGFVVTGNNIYGNGTTSGQRMGLTLNGDVYTGTFDARNNYWGSATGPSGDGSGGGDGVFGSGHVQPGQAWLVRPGQGYELLTPFATAPIGNPDSAYWGLAPADGVRVQAEDFNHGGQGFGYNDADAGNNGGAYRSTGVDVEATGDTGGGYNVGWTTAGEWLDYSVDLAAGGPYQLDFRMASPSPGATFRVLVDGQQVGSDAAVPNTGSWQSFATVSLNNVTLTAGAHTVRVQFVQNGTGGAGPNFNWFQLTNTAPVSTPTAPVNFAAVALGSDQVRLTWANTAGANATNVRVLRSVDGGASYQPLIVLDGSATKYIDAGLTPLTAYAYRVVASNAGGDSPAATASVTTAPSRSAPTPLSQLGWTSATSGWNAPQLDASIKNRPISLRGVTYATGIGTHASSTITYDLGGRFGTFSSDVGVDDEVNGQGNVQFLVYGDGTLLFDSGVLTGTSPIQRATVDVSGVRTLTLVAKPGIDGTIDYDHADWAGAQLAVAAPVVAVPDPPANVTATAGATAVVYVAWTNTAANATGFAIDRSGDGGRTYATVGTTGGSTTAYTDATVAAGTTYTYRVRATGTAGSSAASNAVTVTTVTASAAAPVNLTTLAATSAQTDYGTIGADVTIKGRPITLRGTVYATGVGTHASSTIVYNIGGRYATFATDVGVDDEVSGRGSVRFQIYGDGVLLYDSGVVTGASPVGHANVNVSGVQQLTLVASPGVAGSIDYDHADWAGAKLVPMAAPVATAAATVAKVKVAAAVRFAPVQAKTRAELIRSARSAKRQAIAEAKAVARAAKLEKVVEVRAAAAAAAAARARLIARSVKPATDSRPAA